MREASHPHGDEPSAGLDAESTERLLGPLRRLMRGRTTILISHTLASVRDATSIVVLEAGRVVEHGSPDELAALDGTYARLLRLQEGATCEHAHVTA